MTKKKQFQYENLPSIIGTGVLLIERELSLLSSKEELSESDSKLLISYLNVLRDLKKDNFAEESALKKELSSMSNEELEIFLEETKRLKK